MVETRNVAAPAKTKLEEGLYILNAMGLEANQYIDALQILVDKPNVHIVFL